MVNNKYVVKSLAPWMIDELMAFSEITDFDLILLRKPDDFYKDRLQNLNSNGVNVYIQPRSFDFVFKKLLISLKFLINNLFNFNLKYNGVVGLKSLYWFLKLDIKYFSNESNIHAQFATQAAVVSLLVKRFYSNKPLLSFTFHAYDIYYNNKWFKLLIKTCHKAFSISNFNINYVKKKFIDSDRIVLSRLGVFRDDISKETKKKSDEFVIGLMSWFVEKKGISYLLETLKALKQNGFSNIKLILAGDGPLKEKYLQYINENELTIMVDYLGKIKGHEKNKFYSSLDCFVLPSIKLKNDQDGIPVVLMEAIAYGLPIISTNVSGIPEICINDYNGKMINERNVQYLYDAIVDLHNNKRKRLEYSKNSYSLSKKYDIIINSEKKLKLLNWN